MDDLTFAFLIFGLPFIIFIIAGYYAVYVEDVFHLKAIEELIREARRLEKEELLRKTGERESDNNT